MQQAVETVQASINEGNLFDSMKHLFASNTSIIGELMQNARRAKATKVEFVLNRDQQSMKVIDDGQGIEDMSKLIALCESGWDEDTKAHDNPFGMGVFSYFFAAQTVVFKSNGKMLSITHDDIRNKRPLQVGVSDVTKGAEIEFLGLDEALTRHRGYNKDRADNENLIAETIRKNATGFPIPVFFNGREMDRPHSIDGGLLFMATSVGMLYKNGLTNDSSMKSHISDSRPVLYLQGLPLSGSYSDWRETGVLHLESTAFVAKMPDRSHLFNESEQLALIDAEILLNVQAFLSLCKKMLSPEDFVAHHWENCRQWQCEHLLNDIECVPDSVFSYLARVDTNYETYSDRGGFKSNSSKTVSKEDLVSGKVRAWFNAPGSGEYNVAALARLFMIEEDILGIDKITMPTGHWLHDLLPCVADISFKWEAADDKETSIHFHGNEGSCQFHTASSLKVTAFWDDQEIVHTFDSHWVLVPTTAEEGLCDWSESSCDLDFVCYLFDGESHNHSNAIDVFGNYRDEFESYREEWRDEAITEWEQMTSQVFKHDLDVLVRRALFGNMVQLSADYEGAHCLVMKTPGGDSYYNSTAMLLDDTFWLEVQKLMDEKSSMSMKEAFSEVANTKAAANKQPL